MPVARKVGLPIRVSMPAAFCAPADDAEGVLLEEGIGGKLARLAASRAEERDIARPVAVSPIDVFYRVRA